MIVSWRLPFPISNFDKCTDLMMSTSTPLNCKPAREYNHFHRIDQMHDDYYPILKLLVSHQAISLVGPTLLSLFCYIYITSFEKLIRYETLFNPGGLLLSKQVCQLAFIIYLYLNPFMKYSDLLLLPFGKPRSKAPVVGLYRP